MVRTVRAVTVRGEQQSMRASVARPEGLEIDQVRQTKDASLPYV
jgi:hypothetical protein